MAEGSREQALALKKLLLLSSYILFPSEHWKSVHLRFSWNFMTMHQLNITDKGYFIVFKADGQKMLLFYNNYDTCKKY